MTFMSNSWLRFLLFRFPGAIIAIGLIFELVAWPLRSVAPNRNYLDYLAAAVDTDRHNAPVLIFGDSVTKEVLKIFSIGLPDKIADLTTHGGAGLPSQVLLLRRYLAHHPAPTHVILAMAPDVPFNQPPNSSAKEWLFNVFRRPEELAWLSALYPNLVKTGWYPAAADIENQVLAPLTGIISGRTKIIPVGAETPVETGLPLEPVATLSAPFLAAAEVRASQPLALSRIARLSLEAMCDILKENGIVLDLLTAPTPPQINQRWQISPDFHAMQTQTNELLNMRCGSWRRIDIAADVLAPNFDGFALHIVGRGWQNKYALALKHYVDSILEPHT